MSLLTKTILLFLVVALVVFGIGGIVTYRLVVQEVQLETDYYLHETFKATVRGIRAGKSIEALDNEKVLITQLEGTNWPDTLSHYKDTIAEHFNLHRMEPHRNLTRVKEIDGAYYRISITDVLIEVDDMYEGVVAVLSRLFLYLSLSVILGSVIISRWLFKPFGQVLNRLSHFNLKSASGLKVPKTSTKEFKQLNSFLLRMTDKAQRDYRSLKEFTENASHEMQTPIAVAKGKLELMLESPDLDEERAELIQGAYRAISRLSSIGHSLTLLSKIENQEFSISGKINFSHLLQHAISNFQELAELKGICMEADIEEDVQLPIENSLADILVSNLIKNAIQHNQAEGWIKVKLTSNYLSVKNTGPAPSVDPSLLFERFKKGNQSGGSLGLGLSIVKKIVEVCDWKVSYHFNEEEHHLQVDFTN
jgi:signal transduction histidine kinase